MNFPDVDVILSKLSVKFNRIFYEREFVGCVSEDFRLLANSNKCVLVFPVLSPNYLKALRYQARICDLAVVPLGSGYSRSIAVCRKKYLIQNSDQKEDLSNEMKMPELVTEASKTLRKKRPERQLYVPPAQRKSKSSTEEPPQKVQPRRRDETKRKKEKDQPELDKIPIISLRDVTKYLEFPITCVTCKLHKYSVSKNLHDCEFRKYINFKNVLKHKIHIFDLYRSNDCLYILDEYRLFWQPSRNFLTKGTVKKNSTNYKTYPDFDLGQQNKNDLNLDKRMSVFPMNYFLLISHFLEEVYNLLTLMEYSAFKIECDEVECSVHLEDIIIDMSKFEEGHIFFINHLFGFYIYECNLPHDALECYKEIKSQEFVKSEIALVESDIRTDNVTAQSSIDNSEISQNGAKCLDNSNETELENKLEENKRKTNTNGLLKNDENKKINKNEHEEEKEIMRKTKERINRKTRPIIKYIDEDNSTLTIGKNDNVNNWEDLFDDEGQLQEEYFTEIVQKVGTNVRIVKATEDYTAYASKQMEELEHMVELYDFPSTFETHDIIAAFSELKSDSMYVKWVDDTRALLVLGSSLQAQKALEILNPLIKVRPMSAASSLALAKANKSDLRPAMKRPQTNLQTARRLITTHLGAKSRVTKEQSAKEREDLKAAREMKRLTKKNEQDAWEGVLKSTI